MFGVRFGQDGSLFDGHDPFHGGPNRDTIRVGLIHSIDLTGEPDILSR
jgi:hypothetical protein